MASILSSSIPDEPARLRATWRYTRHNRKPDPVLDAITRLAADLFDVPIVLISLVDRHCQWFKSRVGLDATETPRAISFCAHAIVSDTLLEIPDASADARFADNPLVTGRPYIRYYLGAPLVTPDGFSIGTLCIIDRHPRTISATQKAHLQTLAMQVMDRLELQRLGSLAHNVTQAGIGTWELDIASGAIWGNDTFYQLHGAEPWRLDNWHAFTRDYFPEDKVRLEAGLEKIRQDGSPLTVYLRWQPLGKPSLKWIKLTAALSDNATPAQCISGTLEDVTLFKQQTCELEDRHRVDQVVNRLQSAFITGSDIRGAFANALQELLDYTGSEYGFIGEVFHDAQGAPFLQTHAITDISWDDASRALYQKAKAKGMRFACLDTLYGHVLQTEQPLITNAPDSDPRRGGLPPGHPPLKALLCQPVLMEGKMIAMVGMANRPEGYSDALPIFLQPVMHALAQLIHNLRLQRQQHANWERLTLTAQVFSNSREAITISDAENRIIEVNEAFERITGYASEEVMGKNPSILSSGHHPPEFYHSLWASLEQHGHWEGEITNRRKDGELLPEKLSISVIRNEAGDITHHVAVFSDLTRIKQHDNDLFRAAHFDRLTGMPNRYYMIELMQETIGGFRHQESMAIAVLDLDRFNDLNMRLGREEGDHVLSRLAERLANAVAAGDLVARLGGDEFAILLRHFQQASETLDRIVKRLAQPIHTPGGNIVCVTASLGVTVYPDDNQDPETLLRHAAQAMYRTKVSGGNGYACFDPRHEQKAKALEVRRHAIATALTAEEFVLFYQPQIDPCSQNIVGVEALVRWQHPEKGLLAPGAFLDDMAGTPIELAFDSWVLHQALRQQKAWLAEGLTLKVSVNLTPQSLNQSSFVDILGAALAEYPEVPPALLCLEVLESAALEDFQEATQVMRDCRALGVQIALDDFGTGYASLAYLRNLPIDIVKIDRSFVMSMLEREHDMAIVESVIYLAHRFCKQVIAEGVESNAHSQHLHALGCDLLQGFGISKPMPAEKLRTWCIEHDAS